MAGAVKTAVNAYMSPVNAAIGAAKAIGKGEDLVGITKSTVRSGINPVLHANDYKFGGITEKPGTQYKGLLGDTAPVDVPPPVDPVAVQAENERAKARAKRQSEIDILTDRPGRGGTILTDQYQYKV